MIILCNSIETIT